MTEKVANAVGGPLYPIREVSRLTGVNSVTLRAWERRYGLIQPRRTPKGHRLYAREDIERVERILQWLNRGVPVSQVGELIDQASSDSSDPETDDPSTAAEEAAPGHDWEGQRLDVIDAVAEFDTNRLENLFTRSMGLYPVNTAIARLWQPVVERLENDGADHSTPMAQRCFLESFLRTRLGLRLYHGNHENTEPRILMSYLPGGCGALWQLLFAFTASSAGFYITLFDGSVPVEELIEAARRKGARTIVLSGAMEADIEGLRHQLSQAAYQGMLPIRVAGSITRQLRDTDEDHLSALDSDPARAIAQLRLATARHG